MADNDPKVINIEHASINVAGGGPNTPNISGTSSPTASIGSSVPSEKDITALKHVNEEYEKQKKHIEMLLLILFLI